MRLNPLPGLLASLLAAAFLPTSACAPREPAVRPASLPRIVAANAGAVDLFLELAPPEWLPVLPAVARQYSRAVRERGGLTEHAPLPPFGVEAVLGLEPDLVLAHAWQGEDALRSLERLAVPVLRLADPLEERDLTASLRAVGERVALVLEPSARDAFTERSSARVAALEARLAALRERVLGARVRGEPVEALVYSNYAGDGSAPGAGTTHDLCLRLAGAVNVAARAGLEGHPSIDHERLLHLDPAWIVVGATLDDPTRSETAEHLRTEPDLATLRAVRDDRIVLVPPDLLHATSHRLVDAAELLARRFHPD